MDKVRQAVADVERKLGKINVIMGKGAAKMTVKDMIKQGQKGNSIKSTVKKGVKSAESATATEAEIKELLVQITRIVDLEEKQMAYVIESKPHFDKIHCSGMVRKNLEKSEDLDSCVHMAAVLADKSAPGLKPEIEALAKREQEAIKKVLSAYSGATGGEDQLDDKADDSD